MAQWRMMMVHSHYCRHSRDAPSPTPHTHTTHIHRVAMKTYLHLCRVLLTTFMFDLFMTQIHVSCLLNGGEVESMRTRDRARTCGGSSGYNSQCIAPHTSEYTQLFYNIDGLSQPHIVHFEIYFVCFVPCLGVHIAIIWEALFLKQMKNIIKALINF